MSLNFKTAPKKIASLSISVVTFEPSISSLAQTLESLSKAITHAEAHSSLASAELFIVDNSPGIIWEKRIRALTEDPRHNIYSQVKLLTGHGNIGYGSGHNLAAEEANSDFHLVLNPDVILNEDAILQAIRFLSDNPDTGLLAPYATDQNEEQQFLCKQYPSLFDLILRGFAPDWLKRFFAGRLERYEMRTTCGPQQTMSDIPLVSGCFMFIRRKCWDKVGGFSKKYFMYFEDYDLSLRLRKISHLAYVPAVRIQHFGGNAAKKGWPHVIMFCRSAGTFFQEYGWKLW
jgi:GT2 family glycosyltransferase